MKWRTIDLYYHVENLNKQITDNWKPNDRLKQKSILKIEEQLQDKHLPNNRKQMTAVCEEIPPNKLLRSTEIRPNLIENITKKNSDPAELNLYGNKTVMSYSDDLNKIFTDGSAFKGTINAGYGARIEYADNSCEEIYESCGAHCSNYEAEAFAINAALEKLEETSKNEPNKNNVAN